MFVSRLVLTKHHNNPRMTLFKSMTMLSVGLTVFYEIFIFTFSLNMGTLYRILSIPHNIVMDLDIDMQAPQQLVGFLLSLSLPRLIFLLGTRCQQALSRGFRFMSRPTEGNSKNMSLVGLQLHHHHLTLLKSNHILGFNMTKHNNSQALQE